MSIQVTVMSNGNTDFVNELLAKEGFEEREVYQDTTWVAKKLHEVSRVKVREGTKVAMRKFPAIWDGTDASVTLAYDGKEFSGTLMMSQKAIRLAFC